MKLGLLALWLGLSSAGVAAPAEPGALLRHALDEFREMGADMPFGMVMFGNEARTRAMYHASSRKLSEAVASVGGDRNRTRELAKDALTQYRTVGLWLPFFAIDEKTREGVVTRYLAAEDELYTALRALEAPSPPPPPPTGTGTWTSAGLVWKALGRGSYREADDQCRSLTTPGGSAWQVPALRDLASAFRAMKDPLRNPVFGTYAAQYGEVWTSDAGNERNTYYYIHFKAEQTGISPLLTSHQILCVGKETPK